MDPRPYHFEYRRPRHSNRTFQSTKFHDSIYRSPQSQISDIRQSNIVNSNKPGIKTPQSQPEAVKRHQSMNMPKAQKLTSYRYQFGLQQKKNPSKLSQIGNHFIRAPLDQSNIYEKQERKFDIINCHAKSYTPRLKQFPRLTLQNQLIERNSSLDKNQVK